ncbi:hypothetical protein [Ensifer soli]|uniref:hypothetical protein n=1 Tax=Ciceribacter sp. sgz301302 TaxID=3342379 RepID=UPI0035B8FC58
MKRVLGAMLAGVLATAGAAAQETAATLSVELNALASSAAGCKLTFLAENGLDRSLDKVSFEFVFFDLQGRVERMAVLDFRDLPAGKQKVRQFDVSGTKCEGLKGLLINDTPVCAGEGVDTSACMKALKTGSKAGAELKG